MANLWFVTFILATWAVGAVNSTSRHQLGEPAMSPELEEAVAPTPVIDCSSLIYNMADCLSFLSDGSDETTPDNTCCSGFKLVMDTDADCICEALRSSSDLGIEINMTQVMTLPSACAFSAPFLSSCIEVHLIVTWKSSFFYHHLPAVNPPPKNIAPPPEYQNPAPPEAQNPPPPPPPPEAESPPPASAPPPEAQNPPPPDSENPPAQVPSTSTSPAAKSPAPSPASSAGSSYTTHISFPVLFSMVVACLLYILV
ncbi:non-specific lipid transfer protein GPI-anchored 23-like [Cornus florida]|uniref:non-specific lipid transfer protein GPI-anchored 23-like n=1 Tax=Cornus florida TaxID=4283 RepID=UPI002897A948|nr:non-specific lipid transfer protein GPI-anchored 23-like [Cornus florida]